FPSLWKIYGQWIQAYWRRARGFELEEWQAWSIDHLLELYPEGHRKAGQLRFRQALLTMARQNGKTEMFAAITLILLVRQTHQNIVGVAYNVEQANVLYERVLN